MRTSVYIDGFNFYYRALRGTPFKWLDPLALVTQLLSPANVVTTIRYYTARVSGHVDPDQPRRQQLYLDALQSIPCLSICYGSFLASPKRRPLVHPPADGPRFVEVMNFEEKGSDVNLASHLIHDGWRGAYDVAVVISKDTDLVEPIRIVTQELGKPVGILCPPPPLSPQMAAVAKFIRTIRPQHLRKAQFPNPLPLPDGRVVTKPDTW